MISTARKITQTAKYLLPLIRQDAHFRRLKRIFVILILKLMPYSRVLMISPWGSTQKKTRSGLKRRSWAITPWKTDMMRNMTEGAGILPYYSNHSLRATIVTVLSSNWCGNTTNWSSNWPQKWHKHWKLLWKAHLSLLSSALTSFIHGRENTPPASTSSNPTTSTETQSGNSAERIFTMPTNSVSVSQNEENFLLPNGVNAHSLSTSIWTSEWIKLLFVKRL